MNRRKKLTQAFKKKQKAVNAKLNPKKKERYVSKAERQEEKEKAHIGNTREPI